ncbi:MAG: hypothetical protein ACOY3L_04605 [Pseudomonadota bacterium]
MFRVPTAVFGLVVLLGIGNAFAAEIPQEQLDADFKACMQNCVPKNGEAKCNAFCKCTNQGAQAQFSYEEYQKLASDLNSGALANQDSLNKLKAISATCAKENGLKP